MNRIKCYFLKKNHPASLAKFNVAYSYLHFSPVLFALYETRVTPYI